MSEPYKVGIVIPSYQRSGYLKAAVESVLAQSYANLELVIIDDNSPDPAVRQYLKSLSHPMVRWHVNEKNMGTARNYDAGVRMLSAQTQWCILLDNDDILDKDFITEAVRTQQKFPRTKVIHGRQIWMDAAGRPGQEAPVMPAEESAEDYLIQRCAGRRDIRSSSLFFNVDQFKRIGGYPDFPSGMGTDSVFIFALGADNSIVHSPASRIFIRIHEGAESLTTERLFEKLVSIRMMPDYCEEKTRLLMGKKATRTWKQISGYLKKYGQQLTEALLIQRYRELVAGDRKNETRQKLKAIIRQSRQDKIALPWRFRLYSAFYRILGRDIEKTVLYRKLIGLKRMLKLFKLRTIKLQTIRQALKKAPGIYYLYRQGSVFVHARSFRWRILGWQYCACCARHSLFYWDRGYADLLRQLVPRWDLGEAYTRRMIRRENSFCAHCRSVYRMRTHAEVVLRDLGMKDAKALAAFLKKNPAYVVYETARYNIFRIKAFELLPNYIVSEYHPDRPFGSIEAGVRNENLEALSLEDRSVDLVITSEVLEHVADLEKALSEIHRVLKPDGKHIFTIPVSFELEQTRKRALVTPDGNIDHLMPPAIHGDDISEGILAFRDFGKDVEGIMRRFGFSCEQVLFSVDNDPVTSVYVSVKNDHPESRP